MSRWKRVAMAVCLSVTAAFGAQLVATPAHASAEMYYFYGQSDLWQNFPTLCKIGKDCGTTSGPIVAFWQAIIWADYGGQTKQTCNAFIDGNFGPNTETWTKKWQNEHMYVGAGDGYVGPKTWDNVGTRRRWVTTISERIYYDYLGSTMHFRSEYFYPSKGWTFWACLAV